MRSTQLQLWAKAYGDSVPILNIVAEDESAHLYQDRGIAHESKHQIGVLKRLSQWSQQVTEPGGIPSAIHEGLRRMQVNRPRPVSIEIPIDIFRAQGEVVLLESEGIQRPSGDATDLKRAAEVLGKAQRPLIWCGGGVISGEAWQELQALSERLDAPVLTTSSGRGAIPEDHRLTVGCLAVHEPVQALIERADVMLAIGTRFAYLSTDKWSLPLPRQLIHIDIDSEMPGKNFPAQLGIHADAKSALTTLLMELHGTEIPDHDAWVGDARAARAVVRAELAKRAPLEWSLMQTIRDALPRETIVTADPHLWGYWARSHFSIYEPRTWLHDLGFGTLGYAYPVALGAKLAAPDLPVVAFSGDGGFLFTAQELSTAVKYGLNVPVVIFNDDAYGAIKEDFLRDYDCAYEVDLVNPDFVKFARSFGAVGLRATPETLGDTLRHALTLPGPSVIDMPVKLQRPLIVS